ncbi:MAG: hypothetical protein BWY89_00775 [Bacteroidetes bacterium ADurb.BinA012]|nr:MAG: hypothetical protein BWY89_00775 [Bacteroidetes bacterium ADurb.BinA012]
MNISDLNRYWIPAPTVAPTPLISSTREEPVCTATRAPASAKNHFRKSARTITGNVTRPKDPGVSVPPMPGAGLV